MRIQFDPASNWLLASRLGNQNQLSNALERLSTGLRINRASDDAAGLSISENLRSQIQGDRQASRNVQDAISLGKIAEGAMQEVGDILQRLRELALQANSDTLTNTERQYLQTEMDALVEQVDQINESTQFNSIYVLQANVDEAVYEQLQEGLLQTWLEDSLNRVTSAIGLSANNVDLEIIIEGDLGSTSAYVSGTGIGEPMELHINASDPSFSGGYDAVTNPSGGDATVGSVYKADRVIAHELTHAVMMQNIDLNNTVYDPSQSKSDNTWFLEGVAEYIHGADERLKTELGVVNPSRPLIRNFITNNALSGSWTGSSGQYANAYAFVKYLDSLATGGVQGIISDLAAGINLDQSLINRTSPTFDVSGHLNNYETLSVGAFFIEAMTFDGPSVNSPETDTGALGLSANSEDVIANSIDASATNPTSFNISFEPATTALTMMVGSNPDASNQLEVSTYSASSRALSIYNLDVVSDASSRNEAVSSIDEAIGRLNSKRSSWGATINRLSSIENSLAVSQFNKQDAESRIRDADMAWEMTQFTKAQILQNVQMSVLSKSNLAREGVFNLLM